MAREISRRSISRLLAGFVISFSVPVAAFGQASANMAASCDALANLALPVTEVVGTGIVAANEFVPPGANEKMLTPEFCRFQATSDPAVRFEVWLPVDNWNGKFQVVGNGGMAGTISYAAMGAALRRGYATASTDTGHEAGPIPFDASWASGRMDLIEDFGHRALHLTTVHGKSVIGQFYTSAPAYSYYVGCSKGGQQGLMEAQRYPEDFDGIVAGNPANDWTRFYAGAHLWYSQAMLSDTDAWIPPAKLATLGEAVNQACDANDGIRDGILMNPLACDFQPSSLQCDAGTDTNSCLTPKQVTAVEKIWSGVRNSSGELIYPGLVPGGEAARGSWSAWVTGREPFASLHWRGGEGFFRWFVFDDENWDFREFDYDDDLNYALERVGDAVDAADPDLSAFRENGGKLLVYHGWSDPDISPLASIQYFESVVDWQSSSQTGSVDALARTQDYFRLFMVPGMGHCRGGPGPDQFDALSALENWVENGIAPDSIMASKIEGGTTTRTRPLCVYPEVAHFDGSGDSNDGRNFYCAAPAQ